METHGCVVARSSGPGADTTLFDVYIHVIESTQLRVKKKPEKADHRIVHSIVS